MRKILVLALSLLLIVAPGIAEVADEDLASMSIDELVELRESIDAELRTRPDFEDAYLYTGVYTAGKDIKSGAYVLTCVKSDFGDYLQVRVYSDEEAYRSSEFLNVHSSQEGESVYVRLDEGMIVELFKGTCKIQQSDFNWAP